MAHLTHSERDLIESGLRNHDSFKEIARKVGKSPSSISREVLKHRVEFHFFLHIEFHGQFIRGSTDDYSFPQNYNPFKKNEKILH